MYKLFTLVQGLVLLFSAGSVRAEEPAPAATAPQAPQGFLARLESLTEQMRQFRLRLPFQIGAGLNLWYYQPLSSGTTLAGGSPEGTLQVFAYYVKLDAQVHGFGAHTEVRLRDGGHIGPNTNNSYFRGFYSSNVWFQEVYAFYTPGPVFKVKAGKVYRQLGIFWDDSFFGNIQFYDGIKLNPDYGVSIEGEKDFLGGRIGIKYSAQFFLNSDGINGGIDFKRTIGPTPSMKDLSGVHIYSPNPEGQLDSAGVHLGAERNLVTGRLVGSVRPSRFIGAEIGASFLWGTVVRKSAADSIDDEARMADVVGEATFTLGPVLLYGEYMRQIGPAVRDADYVLAGIRGGYRGLSLRLNTSYVHYDLSPDVQEFIIQPGLTYAIFGGLSGIIEFNEWERKDPRLADLGNAAGFTMYDRSLNFSLVYDY